MPVATKPNVLEAHRPQRVGESRRVEHAPPVSVRSRQGECAVGRVGPPPPRAPAPVLQSGAHDREPLAVGPHESDELRRQGAAAALLRPLPPRSRDRRGARPRL